MYKTSRLIEPVAMIVLTGGPCSGKSSSLAYLTEKLGYRVAEIPIYFEDRRIGKSKMSVPVKLQGAIDVFRIRYRHRKAEPRAAGHPALP
jgi:tRNA uridine 5-carbamoylmethylation protein Kti12